MIYAVPYIRKEADVHFVFLQCGFPSQDGEGIRLARQIKNFASYSVYLQIYRTKKRFNNAVSSRLAADFASSVAAPGPEKYF